MVMKTGRISWAMICLVLTAGGFRAARPSVVGEKKLTFHSDVIDDVISATKQLVVHHLAGCHVILAASRYSSISAPLLRFLSGNFVVVTALETSSNATVFKQKGIWGNGCYPCRALLLDHIQEDISAAPLFLSRSKIWLHPNARVVVMGSGRDVEILSHNSLRNTLHAIYIVPSINLKSRCYMKVYHRCLFCDYGTNKLQHAHHKIMDIGVPKDFDSFRDYPRNFNGHRFWIVTMKYFPYINYEIFADASDGVVDLTDSLNTRMITILSKYLNFTYDVREPKDRRWGLPLSGGNWSGTVGTLQYEKADFSMDLTLTYERTTVAEFCRAYIGEDGVILSKKPRPLPEYLSLISPFEVVVWVMVVVAMMVSSAMLWLLLKVTRISRKTHLSLASTLFYGWGLLMEEQSFKPPPEPSGQVLVATLLVTWVILRVAYTCSLTSHLMVEGKNPAINSLEDMVERRNKDGWKWGAYEFTGAVNSFFSTSNNPAFKVATKEMQIVDYSEGIKRVLEGKFSYIINYYQARILTEAINQDEKSNNPFHISSTKYHYFAGNSWAFRPGTPFIRSFDNAFARFLDSGLIAYWMDDVISIYLEKERRGNTSGVNANRLFDYGSEAGSGEMVLGLLHLQVTFYILMLGGAASTFTFLAEYVIHSFCRFPSSYNTPNRESI